MDEIETILSVARESLPNCDWLSDLYERRTIWVSERLLEESGFTRKEITSKLIMDLIKSDKSLVQLKHEMIERMIDGEGIHNCTLQFKNRNVAIDYKYKILVFQGNRYAAAELIRIDGREF